MRSFHLTAEIHSAHLVYNLRVCTTYMYLYRTGGPCGDGNYPSSGTTHELAILIEYIVKWNYYDKNNSILCTEYNIKI
jgi:hypothetical protein